ncbi:MAG: hypothetical protein U0840_22885 [Gemmataceae bacterium]
MLFAFVGNAGMAIFFVLTLVIWVVLFLYTIVMMARTYMVAVQGTIAGLDEVRWPNEPVVDWLGEALFLTSLVAIWLVPIGTAARLIQASWLPEELFLRILVLAGPVLWIIFPLSLLSSLGSESRWQILNLRVLGGLLQFFPELLGFYLVTALLGVVVFGLLYLGLFSAHVYLLPIAAALAAAGLLIHARLVGRLGWKLGEIRSDRPRRREEEDRPTQKPRRKRRPRAVPNPSREPIRRAASSDESESFDLLDGPAPEVPPAPRPSYLDPEPEPYILAGGTEEPASPEPPRVELNQEQVEREIALRTRTPPNPPPAMPMLSGVYTFPLYVSTLPQWGLLTLWLLFAGGAWRAVRALFPF